jgi:hypothetical protein
VNRSEEQAERFLIHEGLGPVAFEPDGNQPPDLVTADGTAVEVRRLNKHRQVGNRRVPLETATFSLLGGVLGLLHSFGPASQGESWWVSLRFRRPLPKWRRLEPEVRRALEEVAVTRPVADREISPTTNLSLIPRLRE